MPLEDNDDVFELVSDNDLKAGDEIAIIYVATTEADETAGTEASTTYIGMSTTQNNNNRGQTLVNANDDGTLKGNNKLQVITLEAATTTAPETSEVNWWLNVGNGYLYAASSGSNHLKTEVEPDANGNANAAISITEGVASIVFQGNYTRNTLRYNSSNELFSCYDYDATTQKDVKIYRKRTGLPGDANMDGKVTVADVMVVVNYVIKGADGVPVFNFKNANVNGDAAITVSDVMAIVKIVTGQH